MFLREPKKVFFGGAGLAFSMSTNRGVPLCKPTETTRILVSGEPGNSVGILMSGSEPIKSSWPRCAVSDRMSLTSGAPGLGNSLGLKWVEDRSKAIVFPTGSKDFLRGTFGPLVRDFLLSGDDVLTLGEFTFIDLIFFEFFVITKLFLQFQLQN